MQLPLEAAKVLAAVAPGPLDAPAATGPALSTEPPGRCKCPALPFARVHAVAAGLEIMLGFFLVAVVDAPPPVFVGNATLKGHVGLKLAT